MRQIESMSLSEGVFEFGLVCIYEGEFECLHVPAMCTDTLIHSQSVDK